MSDAFLFTSLFERYPNALLESCTVGTPVIAFKAPGGTKEIVINGVNGFLVEDEIEFVSVLNDFNRLRSIDNNEVISSVQNKFKADKIVKRYEELLNTL